MLRCAVLAAASLLLSIPACAQVYSWNDPGTGGKKLSNIAPPWYSRREEVPGPRVVVTFGGKVIDDTALDYEARLRLFGAPQISAEAPRPAPNPPLARAQAQTGERDEAGAKGARMKPEDLPPIQPDTAGKK